jgi:hypothetical protein
MEPIQQMLKAEDNPVAQAVIVGGLYIVGVAALMFGNELAMGSLEIPWLWIAVWWGGLFAPTLVATVFAAVFVAPPWRRLKRLYGGALFATLGVIELLVLQVLWLNAANLGTAVIAEGVLIVAVLLTFWHYR